VWGFELAGQRVTLRMDGAQMAVISHDGALRARCPAQSRPVSGTGMIHARKTVTVTAGDH
jgi:DNA repair exonuclease SbcCD ATPase subunit